MTALAHRIMLAGGLPRAVIAFLSGAVGAFALPPFGFLPALVPSLVPAVWLLDGAASAGTRGATVKAAAWIGWCWGFGFFIAGLWWLGAAFLVEADQFAWAMPLGVLGLPAALALFPAFGFVLARALWSPGAMRIVALAVGLAAADYLRGHLLTGFPWNALGMALAQNAWLMQGASIIGLYGLSLAAVLIAAAPATLATGETARERWLPTGLALGLLAGLAVFGALRIPTASTPSVAGVKLRLMQPNLPQDAKFRPENREPILRRYLTLSDRATSPERSGVADVTHLIWPESAFPFLLHRDPEALSRIAALLPPGVTLVTGAARADDPLPGEEARRIYNAIQVVHDDGSIAASYDKVHLVPFGEYLPRFLDQAIRGLGLRQFVATPGGFSAATARRPLEVRGLPPTAASICYEAIFPGAVLPRGPRPGLILNVTNDAWFGQTPGPYQHFAQARLRAVEEGLPLVRAANTGISAVVDPYGRVVASLPLGVEGVLDADLPQKSEPTLYSLWGDLWYAALLFACAAACLFGRRVPRPVTRRLAPTSI
jgi:apolipoprotein N-acyltransferase